MGYRSQVRIMTTEEDYNALKTEFNNKFGGQDYNLLEECSVKIHHNGYVYFGWDSIKWYTTWVEYYGDVTFIDNFIREKGRKFSFVRIGEEWDDIEELYCDNVPTIPMIRGFDEDDIEGVLERGW